MANLQEDRGGGDELGRRPDRGRTRHFDHLAVGYADRADLDEFIDGEGGNLVVRGPIHTGARVAEIGTLGAGATRGTPCLVVPLIHERIDEIQGEVEAALAIFMDRWEPEGYHAAGEADGPGLRGGARAESEPNGRRRRTIADTGGTARGASSGAIRKGSLGPRDG